MMPDGPVVIASQDNATTTIKASGTARRYTLRGMPGDDFPPLPQPAEGSPTLALDVDVLVGAHREDALLDLDRRDARAPEQRAVRVGRRRRSHGHDRRSPPLEDRREGRRASGVGDDADPAEGDPRASPALRRDARGWRATGADGEKTKPELLITQSGASAFFQGGGHDVQREARRRAVPAVLAGHPASEREGRSRAARRPSPMR